MFYSPSEQWLLWGQKGKWQGNEKSKPRVAKHPAWDQLLEEKTSTFLWTQASLRSKSTSHLSQQHQQNSSPDFGQLKQMIDQRCDILLSESHTPVHRSSSGPASVWTSPTLLLPGHRLPCFSTWNNSTLLFLQRCSKMSGCLVPVEQFDCLEFSLIHSNKVLMHFIQTKNTHTQPTTPLPIIIMGYPYTYSPRRSVYMCLFL